MSAEFVRMTGSIFEEGCLEEEDREEVPQVQEEVVRELEEEEAKRRR